MLMIFLFAVVLLTIMSVLGGLRLKTHRRRRRKHRKQGHVDHDIWNGYRDPYYSSRSSHKKSGRPRRSSRIHLSEHRIERMINSDKSTV